MYVMVLMGLLSSVNVSIIVIVVSEGLPSVISFLTRWMEVDLLEVQVVQQSPWRVE